MGGRPKGSGTFVNAGQLRAALAPIIRDLRRQNQPVRKETVCRLLAERLGRPRIVPRQLDRWLADFDLVPWSHFIETI